MQHRKIKSVAKVVAPESDELNRKILNTMANISAVVGATLGPGGKQVLIERQEFGVPNVITKDGVTVFRSLGFHDPVAHAIMEAARDASVRTATEAGDGTTTATVLAEAFVRNTYEFCKAHPKVSPQRVVRYMQKLFKEQVEPYVKSLAIPVDNNILLQVAKCSTNGDDELATAIAKCFELVGDDGNVTITEQSGPSGYHVEQLKGYPVGTGYEDCCGKFFTLFVNDRNSSRVYLDKPLFVLYHGVVTDVRTIEPLMQKIGLRWDKDPAAPKNVVLVATGFSDNTVGELALNWSRNDTINVYPLVIPRNIMQSGQMDFLLDLQAITATPIYDPVSRPLQKAELEELGPPLEYFEAFRWRSNIVGQADEALAMARIEEVQAQLSQLEGIAEKTIVQERLGKLTGGIAKLVIYAPTSGELREKRDRAEDAACAWRGAAVHGALPGGGWTLLKTSVMLLKLKKLNEFEKNAIAQVVCPSLEEPVWRLLSNAGYSDEEASDIIDSVFRQKISKNPKVFDIIQGRMVYAKQSGVIDSLPAVLEAIRNSLSIASLLGTLGGAVVFPRDTELERKEAQDNYEWIRNASEG